MLLDLNKLHGSREHFERTLQPSVFDPEDPEYRLVAPVELSMDVEKTGVDAFAVTGRVKARLELTCSRCVDPFEMAVDEAFDLRYVPQKENAGEGEREVESDDLTVAFYSEGVLDVVELLREQFQLTLPMKPLCISSCLGLCVHCGGNLNRTVCSCAPAWEDPRLAPLKGLLSRQKEN